ncbi:Nicotinate-nucleotide adenylyltransferase [Kingella potus]|uniref:Probable nicotinate-nucleotide adenylyltransferase n=1 Tax=Kingella potus TaxID=265175 RepID=A0A377R3U6_9NEIS|nr:nicotinate-nucleotide adenylyltransferase [Kingella potus]UOP00708.1 nicotinate-nucleotide adenylyltransferase [Kingella potus]STR02894.1 Nicotinate-nucleotide adenylyltransferase [Kingella potus]
MTGRLGLFGGTFDPPHLGHTHIARAFADELDLDTVIFLPAGDPYHKAAPSTPAAHRLAMTQLAAQADPRFAVSDLDTVRGGTTYTADTVRIFRQHYPAAELWWLMGADSLAALHTWKDWPSIVRQTRIAAAARSGFALSALPSELHAWAAQALNDGSLHLLSAPLSDISSTDIRGRLKNGQHTGGLLDPAVAAYIRRHKLYGGSPENV